MLVFRCLLTLCVLLGLLPQTAKAHYGDHQDQPHHHWLTNYAVAQSKAKAHNKRLLVKFTGSDWSKPCKWMWDQILSHHDFQHQIEKDYVLLYIDFPRREMLSEALTKQNRALAQKYGVTQFPTMMILDADGKEQFSTTGAPRHVKPNEYKAWLEAAEKTYKSDLAKLSSTEGLAKARLLDKLLRSPARFTSERRMAFMKEIIQLTPENTDGLKHYYEMQLAYDQMMNKFYRNEVSSVKEAHQVIDAFIEESKPDGAMLQRALRMKAGYYQRQRDVIKAYETYKKAYEADPDSAIGKSIAESLPRMKQAADLVRKMQDETE